MAEMSNGERATVDQTPDPQDIDRAPATERASKMPSIPGTTMDPKKMIGFAAAAGAIMFTVLALGTGLTGNSTLPPVKPKPALEPAQYDPASVIAPTLAGAATRSKCTNCLGRTDCSRDWSRAWPYTGSASSRTASAPAIPSRSAPRRGAAIIADCLWRRK